MKFSSCDTHTLGVEWELQLLDGGTLDLHPGIGPVLESFARHPHVKPEFIQSCVELNSPVTHHSSQVQSHFLALTSEVLQRCEDLGMTLAGAGTHPFCRRLALITPLPRYEALAAEHGYIGQTQMAFATHVHVGMPSGDEAMRVMRYLTPCLPLLIAIAANSPFWRGHRTGYASYRRRLLAASRSYGIPPYFDDWSSFSVFFDMARRTDAIRGLKDIHWDIRPHPDFGTLEFRVMDAQSTISEVTFIAGFVRVLVAWVVANPRELIEAVLPRRISAWIERENHFRASHWGLKAQLIHDEFGETRPLVDYLRDLASALKKTAARIGEENIAALLSDIDKRTPGYMMQRADYDEHCDIRSVASNLRERLRSELTKAEDSTY